MGKYRALGALFDRVFRNDLNKNFDDIDTDIKVQKARVDNLITGNPQPEEVMDLRVDDEGIIHPTAKDRFASDEAKKTTKFQQIDDQLSKKAAQVDVNNALTTKRDKTVLITQNDIADELKQQIAGTAPINAVPSDGGITTPKYAENSIEVQKTKFIKRGKNLFDFDARSQDYSFDNSGNLVANVDYDVTDFIPVTSGLQYTLNKPRTVFFYDTNKVVIAGSKIDNVGNPVLTVTVPANAAYLRAAVYYSFVGTFQVEQGTSTTAFEPFKLEINALNIKNKNLDLNSVDRKNLIDKSVAVEKADFITMGKNLFNLKKATDGSYLQETSGNLIANANFISSDFIPVKSGTTYTISSVRKFIKYDLNKVFLSGLNQTQGVYTFTADSDGYIRFSYDKTLASNVQMEIGSTVTTYEAYGYTMPDLIVPQSGESTDILSGKSLYSFGDSIMKGAGNGNVGLRDLIAQKYNMSGANYAVSGASLAYYADRSHIVAQIQSAITAGITPDCIIMNGGINDVTFNVLGDIAADYNYEANGYATFSAGLEYCFGLLKTTFPSIPLVYIWVHRMPSRDQVNQTAHHDRALEISKKWSVPVVDMYKDGGMNTMLNIHLQNFTYYPTETSGTHPNADGYNKFYVPAVVTEIRKRLTS